MGSCKPFYMIVAALFLMALLLAPSAGFAGEEFYSPRFLTTLQDVPLMPGLSEVEEDSMMFDKPSGRIAESTARAESLATDEIEKFYSATLPQLGWLETKEGAYVRQNEELNITVANVDGESFVRFMLTPR